MSEELWDAPNQQVVRPDQSPPWEEGEGGSEGAGPKSSRSSGGEPTVDEMTKAQLLERAAELDLDVDDQMTKAELRAAINEAG
jgi:hypothetical protein